MQLDDILEKTSDGICVCSSIPDEPFIIFSRWNHRMEEITGYTIKEINNLGWHKTMYSVPELQPKSAEHIASFRNGNNNMKEEWTVVSKDGKIKSLSVSISEIKKENNQTHFLAVMQDITAQKHNEETINKLQAQFSHALEIAQLAPWEYDVRTDTFRFNDYFYKLFGTSAEEVGGYELTPDEYAERFLYPDDIPVVRKETQKALKTKDPDFARKLEHRIKYSDGSTGHMSVKIYIKKDAMGNTITTYGVNQDITDLKKMEEKLIEATEKYSIIFNRSVEGLYVHNLDGQIIDANEIACQQTGYSREELLKMNALDLHVDTDDTLKLSEDEVFKSWRKREPGEKVLIFAAHKRKDGTVFPVQITSGAAYFGKTKNILSVVQDITERKRAEEEKDEMTNRLQQAQKMESIGTLAGGIAHDFNNILLPAMLHTEIIINDLPPDHPLQEDAKEVLNSAKRAKELVQQILTFARKKAVKKIVLRSSLAIREVIKFLRSTIPATIDIIYDVKTDQDTILADPVQLNQIVINLCSNAAHSMKDNGGSLKITIDSETLSNKKTERFPGLKPGKYIKLSVEDTGTGIAPDVRDKIFEPYFTEKRAGEGTGLGLSIIHGIVKNFGGDIDVKSILGKGTAFHVYLPYIKAEAEPQVENKHKIQGGGERILFIDDEKPVVDISRKILKRLGYTVTAITDAARAFDIFKEKPEDFDLVITDMTMPEITGKELFHEMRKIKPGLPVIICTGFSHTIDEKEAAEIGINGFIYKPITKVDMARVIREVLDSTSKD